MIQENTTDDKGFSEDLRGQNQMEGKGTTPSELTKPYDFNSKAYLEARLSKVFSLAWQLPKQYENIYKWEDTIIEPENGPYNGELTIYSPKWEWQLDNPKEGIKVGDPFKVMTIDEGNLIKFWNSYCQRYSYAVGATMLNNETLEVEEPTDEEDEDISTSDNSSSSSTDSGGSSGGDSGGSSSSGSSGGSSSGGSSGSSSSSGSSGGGINANAVVSTATSAIGLGVLGAGTLSMLKNAGPEMIKEMVPELINEAIKVMTDRAGQLAGQYVSLITKMTLQIPIDILKYAKIRFNWTKADVLEDDPDEDPEIAVLKKTIGQMIIELGGPTEKVAEAQEKKTNENKTKKFIQNVAKKAPEILKKTDEFIKDCEKKLELVMTYAVQGPEYIEQQMNIIINNELLKVDEALGEIFKTVYKEVNKFCKDVGYWQGIQLILAYNKLIELAAKAVIYLQSKMTAKAQAQAKKAIQVAKLQIMSKINIELPI